MSRHTVTKDPNTDLLSLCDMYCLYENIWKRFFFFKWKEKRSNTRQISWMKSHGWRGGWQPDMPPLLLVWVLQCSLTGNKMGWNTVFPVFQMFTVCRHVSSQLWARLLIDGTLQLRVTQHFRSASWTKTESLILGFMQKQMGLSHMCQKWKTHAFELWGGRLD